MPISYLRYSFLLFCGIIFCAQTFHYEVHLTDDARIFFRYAENISEGYGVVWNYGEEPVEGISSPLWLFLLSFGGLIGISPVIGSKLMAGISLIGVVWLMQKCLHNHKVSSLVPIFLFLCTGAVYYWSYSGMETALYMLCFTLSFASIQLPRFRYAIPLLGLLRPEGFLLLGLCSFLWWRVHQDKRYFLIFAWIPTILYFVFRVSYFGFIFPNTYYAKVGAPFLERFTEGVAYASSALIVLLLLAWSIRTSKSRLVWALYLGCWGQCTVIALGGGDWMNWGRMLIPLIPSLIILYAVEVSRGYSYLLLSFFFLYPYCTPPKAWMAIVRGETLPLAGFQEGGLYLASKDIAKDIQVNIPKGSTIAINHAGFLPYYLPKYNFIDMTGLNDVHIAHQAQGGLHQKYDVEYVLDRKPDLVVFNTLTKPKGSELVPNYWVGETELYAHPNFQKNYQMIPVYYERERFGGGKAYIILFSRYGSTD